MSELHRNLAPIVGEVWKQIDAEASRVLRLHMAARKLVDFDGPRGWTTSALHLGRTEPVDEASIPGVEARVRRVQPLVELRVPFTLSRSELDAAARGADDADLDPLVEAAKRLAEAEDRAVFHGFESAGIRGICSHSAHKPVSLSEDYTHYPQAVTEALERLRQSGADGPYALALGPRCDAGLRQTAGEGGYPVLRHVTRLIDGPVVWAPAVDGAAVMSLRGGDFELVSGRDPAVGYRDHDERSVHLYLEESFAFRLLGPEAAVPLVYGA
jgi:uncharacterized linocin/CFP29 family protein